MPLSDPCPHHGVCALDSIPQMWKVEENSCKVMTALGGSEMVVRLIDARQLNDKEALEMALEWLSPEAGLTVIFLAMKPLAKKFERKSRRKRLLEMFMEKCSITLFDLDLIILTKEHIMEEGVKIEVMLELFAYIRKLERAPQAAQVLFRTSSSSATTLQRWTALVRKVLRWRAPTRRT